MQLKVKVTSEGQGQLEAIFFKVMLLRKLSAYPIQSNI